MKIFMALLLSILLVACGGEPGIGEQSSESTLEAALLENTSWPFEQVGILDIVEAGGYEDSDFPDWAVGFLVTADDELGVSIEIGAGVVRAAGIDIDSGEAVRVWLDAPEQKYGAISFPVVRIEAL